MARIIMLHSMSPGEVVSIISVALMVRLIYDIDLAGMVRRDYLTLQSRMKGSCRTPEITFSLAMQDLIQQECERSVCGPGLRQEIQDVSEVTRSRAWSVEESATCPSRHASALFLFISHFCFPTTWPLDLCHQAILKAGRYAAIVQVYVLRAESKN